MFSSLRMTSTLNLIGAIVGVYAAGGGQGLGYERITAKQSIDAALVTAITLVATVTGVVVFLAVAGVERLVLSQRGQTNLSRHITPIHVRISKARLAVKPCRNGRAPIGPISPLQNRPASGSGPRRAEVVAASWSGTSNKPTPRPLQVHRTAAIGALSPNLAHAWSSSVLKSSSAAAASRIWNWMVWPARG